MNHGKQQSDIQPLQTLPQQTYSRSTDIALPYLRAGQKTPWSKISSQQNIFCNFNKNLFQLQFYTLYQAFIHTTLGQGHIQQMEKNGHLTQEMSLLRSIVISFVWEIPLISYIQMVLYIYKDLEQGQLTLWGTNYNNMKRIHEDILKLWNGNDECCW